jgi:hypothetical protein
MKRIALLVAVALSTSPAWAQEKKAAEVAKKQATKEAAKPAVVAESGKKSRRAEDARHCLEKPSNTEVIKCAEAYL